VEKMKIAREKDKEVVRVVEKIKKIGVLDTVHTLLSEIQSKHLKSPKLSNYILSKNVKGKTKQLLASAYILYLYKLHRLYILD